MRPKQRTRASVSILRGTIVTCALLAIACGPKVDNSVFGTWVVIGIKNTAEGATMQEKGYSVEQSIQAFRIAEGSLTEYIRGVDSSFLPFGGNGMGFYDSVSVAQYDVTVDEGTISSSDIKTMSYSLKTVCGASLLKLSTTGTGYDPRYGTVRFVMSNYCAKVLADSLPASWPKEDAVTKPDSACDVTEILSW